ncbi:MAG: SpoIIE family protein phosphatase [Verrucomicrobiales bacterium]|nr:SpoIIE family protein phosphatase [Verrucomicrobiales bacterium]
MEHFLYGAALVILTGVAVFLWRREHGVALRHEKEKDAIEREERRMFGFLHGLGEELQEDTSPANMHSYIVNGVVEVIRADAGILYLLDAETSQLVPVAQTESLAPVIPLPTEILTSGGSGKVERAYRNYVRLSPLPSDGNLLGETLGMDEGVYLPELKTHSDFQTNKNPFLDDVAFLGAPLVYGQKRVGVLAVVKKGDKEFTQNDREVFDSVAEQSAYALGSAIIHIEVNEKRRLERELEQAGEIQKVLLPRVSPELTDYDVSAEYRAARILSGDYYDYLRVDDDRYGIAIGDVCGKGVAASLIMAMCRTNLRGRTSENLSPASVLHDVNRLIFPDIREDLFVSLLYLILERGSNEITLARAGHEPPILFHRETGEIELIEPPGLAAGIDEGPVFKRSVKDHRFTMDTGDILLLYTDGIIESENRMGDEYGVERLCEIVKMHSGTSSSELIQIINEDVIKFSEGTAQTDDITLIAIEKR